MRISYDVFSDAFYNKITEYELINLNDFDRDNMVDQYMKVACAKFNNICRYDLTAVDEEQRMFLAEIPDEEIDEIADIISTGMVVQWLYKYVYHQENLENILNTKDYSMYSPAELTYRIKEVFQMSRKDFRNMQVQYSYDHGDLSDLHL